MKRTISLPLLVLLCLNVFGQLNKEHNHLRAGDVLVKQQVEYIDPGESGKNKVWDFSKLKTINDEYTLTYSMPPLEEDSVYILGDNRYPQVNVFDNELLIGHEHNTMYYYRQTNDSLFMMGHENASVKVKHTNPILVAVYPMNFGQNNISKYISEGIYSGLIDIKYNGTIQTEVDAYGKIILPSGDSLSPVLRIKTTQLIKNKDLNIINEDLTLETYRWYSKGYRYPVFEIINNIKTNDKTKIFSTAFFFPPQDHLYLDYDPANQKLLDEIWNVEVITKNHNLLSYVDENSIEIEQIISCEIYPNPVVDNLILKYELFQDTDISFQLYSITGNLVRLIEKKKQIKGDYLENIDCSSLYPSQYILRIKSNNKFINHIIIKN